MDGSGRARRAALAAVALAAALVPGLVPAAFAAGAAGERAFGAMQVACPRDAARELPESSRIACWDVEPGTVLPALRRSDATGERLRIDLLRRVHVVVRMTYDEGSDGWISAGEPPAGLIVGDDGAISNGNVWVGSQVYELRRLDRRTYVVGQVYRYAARHPGEPTAPPMTSPTVVERPPAPPRTAPPSSAPPPRPAAPPARAASPSAVPPARPSATPAARRTATPRPPAPATPAAVATPSPVTVAVPAPAGPSRLPLVGLAAAALAAVGLAAARARRGGGSARPGRP